MKLERAREDTKCYICDKEIKAGEIVSSISVPSGFYRVHPVCRQELIDKARKGNADYQHPKGATSAKRKRLNTRVPKKS